MLKKLYYKIFKRYRQLEIRCANYYEAIMLIQGNAIMRLGWFTLSVGSEFFGGGQIMKFKLLGFTITNEVPKPESQPLPVRPEIIEAAISRVAVIDRFMDILFDRFTEAQKRREEKP